MSSNAPWEDFEFSDDFDDDYEIEFDCHMRENGQCDKAGSEECDFECPYRFEELEDSE
jgi:hypothetical protein